MVIFSDLRISSDGNNLFLCCEVAPYRYFDAMYITQVSVDTEETFTKGTPSSKAKVVASYDASSKTRYVSLNLSPSKLGLDDFNGHIFYVYVQVEGVPSADTPCGYDTEYTMGIVINWQPIYHMGVNYIGEFTDCCSRPTAFIDYYLKLKAFMTLLQTAQYIEANQRYVQWFKNAETGVMATSSCGCGK